MERKLFLGYRCTLSMKYHTPDVMDRLSPALTNDLGHENKEGYDKDNGKHEDQDANTNTNPLGTTKGGVTLTMGRSRRKY